MSSEMRLIYRRDIIRNVLQRFNKQYMHYEDNRLIGMNDGRAIWEIRKDLMSLDLETCSWEDVNRAMGATGWADNNCDVCGGNCEVLLRIGGEPAYDARWQDLCGLCLEMAADILSTEVCIT